MSTAAIVIDNFLSESQWDTIQSGVTSHLNSTLYGESKDHIIAQFYRNNTSHKSDNSDRVEYL